MERTYMHIVMYHFMQVDSGQTSGDFMYMTNVLMHSERVTRAPVVVPQKNLLSADEFLVTIPPLVTVGEFVGAALQQKSALEAALRLWDVSYGGVDPEAPRVFIPMEVQGRFHQWKVVFQEDEPQGVESERGFVMEMRSKGVVMAMDMVYHPDILRQVAQKFDSDHRLKEFGAVVGGNTVLAAEEMQVVLGPFPNDPMMDARGLRMEGLMVGASKSPDPAKCVTVLTSLTPVRPAAVEEAKRKAKAEGEEEEERATGLFLLQQSKDGLPLKLFGDTTIQASRLGLIMVYMDL